MVKLLFLIHRCLGIALGIAAAAAAEYGLQGGPRLVEQILRDQWTVYASYDPCRSR